MQKASSQAFAEGRIDKEAKAKLLQKALSHLAAEEEEEHKAELMQREQTAQKVLTHATTAEVCRRMLTHPDVC